ncbi:zinc finger protein ZIPIC-like [Mytilus trossulus]|uniref:zinc finger protein ZIPIC-like n=1 Tax=Mytilus trossulus TaxID=6551 RepID=UPI003004FDEE
MQEVKWKESRYKESLSTALYKLQQADCLCDIWICTKTRMVPVHRLMLEAFTGPLCNTSVKDGTSPISNFIDICSRFARSIVLILVRYLYTGEVIIDVELISEFIKLCKLLHLDSVVLGMETEMEFLNKNVKQEVTYLDNNSGFCPERTSQPPVPVSLITNKNNESETFEDSFIQQNSDFIEEVKKEITGDFGTLNVRLGSSSPCENNKRGQEREKHNENQNETISVEGSIDIDDDNENASPQKRQRLSENNQSVVDIETEKRLYKLVCKMTSDDESNIMEKRTCSKCNKVLEITKYLKHMKNEHSLFACPMCDWIGHQIGHLSDHMHSQHKVVISSKKTCGIKTVETSEESELMYITQAEPFQQHIQLSDSDELDQSSIISNLRKPHERNDSNTEKLPTSQRTALSKSIKELWQTEINSDQTSVVMEGIRQSCTSRIPNQATTSENLDFDILDPQPLENLEQILEIANSLPSLPEIQQDVMSITDTKDHLNTTKDLSKEGKNMDERVKCKLCDIIVGKRSLRRHERTHGHHLKCPSCSAKFTEPWALKNHILRHSEPYVCDTCGKTFMSSSGLHVHMRRHDGNQRFVCHECGKSFSTHMHYQGHINSVHLNKRDHICEHCNKGFSYKTSLDRHKRECKFSPEENREEYSCEYCGTKTKSLRFLQEHIKGKHKKQQIICHCGKIFAWTRSYKRHQKSCLIK